MDDGLSELIDEHIAQDTILKGLRDLDNELHSLSAVSKSGGKGAMTKQDALRLIGIVSAIREDYNSSLTRFAVQKAKREGEKEVAEAILEGIQKLIAKNNDGMGKPTGSFKASNKLEKTQKSSKPNPQAKSTATGEVALTYAQVALSEQTEVAETVDQDGPFTLVQAPKKRKRKNRKSISAKITRRRQNTKAVVLHLTDKGSEDIMLNLKSHVNPSDSGLRIKAVKNTRDNGVLIVTDKDSNLDAIVKNEALKNIGFQFSEPRKPKPKLMIRGVLAELENDEMLSVLGSQNNLSEELIDARVVFKTNSKAGSKDRNWVIEVNPEARTKILTRGRLYVKWESVRVQEYFHPIRCFKCHHYGHMATSCTQTDITCMHCAANGHDKKNCPSINDGPKCPSCKARGHKNDHKQGSKACRSYNDEVVRMKTRML
jgi:hypothetical protein